MTKKLEDLLNLAPASAFADISQDDDTPTLQQIISDNRDIITQIDSTIDRIDAALPSVRGLEATDDEMDELATLAQKRAEDLIDLGMNTDPRFAGVILQTASQMLGHAITAKTAKMDRKLKTIQLQLQKAKLDAQLAKDAGKTTEAPGAAIEGQGIVLDRNELLRQILNNQPSQK